MATAPSQQDLVQAGVWWLERDWSDYSDVYEAEEEEYIGNNVYFTRLHVRYNRSSFPQDLQFQVTPNKENYQARYIITHPARGSFDCEEGKAYLKKLKQRRQQELQMLAQLTGKGYSDWDVVLQENNLPGAASYASVATRIPVNRQKPDFVWAAVIGLVGMGSLIGFGRMRKP